MTNYEMSRNARPRRGVALLTVMMTLVLIASIAAAGRAQTGAGVAALERDIAVTRARWHAEGCAQHALAFLNESVRAKRDTAWNDLDLILSGAGSRTPSDGCDLMLEPLGRVRNVNSIDSATLVRLFRATGIAARRSDSLASALLDWCDPDSVARIGGAERSWYRDQNRPAPRDGRLKNLAELRLIRGFEGVAFVKDTVGALLGIDSARVDLRHAPLSVLLSLQGLPEPIARELDRTRSVRGSDGRPIVLSGAGGGLGLVVVTTPDSWMLIVRARAAELNAPVETRLRLGRATDRVGVLAVEEDR